MTTAAETRPLRSLDWWRQRAGELLGDEAMADAIFADLLRPKVFASAIAHAVTGMIGDADVAYRVLFDDEDGQRWSVTVQRDQPSAGQARRIRIRAAAKDRLAAEHPARLAELEDQVAGEMT